MNVYLPNIKIYQKPQKLVWYWSMNRQTNGRVISQTDLTAYGNLVNGKSSISNQGDNP